MFGFSHAMMIIFHTHLHTTHTHLWLSERGRRRGTKKDSIWPANFSGQYTFSL